MKKDRVIGLIAVIGIIGVAIWGLEAIKPETSGETNIVEIASKESSSGVSLSKKESMYEAAKEIVNPNGFINVDENFKLADIIGKKVILVEFWTYSCINCQRTLPYITAWYDKYADSGLEIVGVHTPEFDFEKDINNVREAVKKDDVKYPVVLDNDYATWRAYGNRYWPRRYLVDIDGYIVYDHIGEGAYEETEQKIQELLAERKERLGDMTEISKDVVQVDVDTPSSKDITPEIYFGAQRNEFLANGDQRTIGVQQLFIPTSTERNHIYLGGSWDIQPQLAENLTGGAKIVLQYKAEDVHMVARADAPIRVKVSLDGQESKEVIVQQDDLYTLINNEDTGEHTLELIIEGPGLQVFTFTFG